MSPVAGRLRRAWGSAAGLALTAATQAATAQDEPAPLPTLTHDLACAASDEQTALVLERLRRARTRTFGVPGGSPGDAGDPADAVAGTPRLRAASLDRLLRVLARIAARSPELRRAAEEVVLSWSFCAVRFDDRIWDLSRRGDHVVRTPATPPAPDGWEGFAAWGFVGRGDPRYVPALITHGPLYPGQVEHFIRAVTRDRCFPHPATGKTIFADEPDADDLAALLPASIQAHPGDPAGPLVPAEDAAEEGCPLPPVAPPAPVPEAPAQPPAKPPDLPVTAAIGLTALPPPGSAGVPPLPMLKTGIAGGVSQTFGLRTPGVPSFGTRVGFSPKEYFFMRVGVDLRNAPQGFKAGYSWGIGYDDWHPGTVSVQMNHWGPIPFDKPDLKGAMFDIGYKLPLPEVIQPYLSASVGFNMPLSGSPGLGVTLTVKPYENFFLMASARLGILGLDKPTWAYGFGLSNWRPFTVSIAYYNWGPNPIPSLNFVENGGISASFSWEI